MSTFRVLASHASDPYSLRRRVAGPRLSIVWSTANCRYIVPVYGNFNRFRAFTGTEPQIGDLNEKPYCSSGAVHKSLSVSVCIRM